MGGIELLLGWTTRIPGVHGFWKMNSNINRYIYDKSNSFRLSKDLEKAIFKINGYTYYLDVEKNSCI